MKKFLKIVNSKKVKFVSILTFLLFIYICILAYSYVYSVSSDLSSSVFRLHVIANRDSEEYQNIKYKVRDNLIEYMNNLCSDCNSKQEVIEIATNHIGEFKKIAENTVVSEGYSYPVDVEIGNFSFPTKTYGDISFPSGYYDALRVKIGDASGQNWWCVLYPSLCFVDVSSGIVPDESKSDLQNSLSDEEYDIVSNNSNIGINFKFKIIELLNNTSLITARNN